VVAIKGSALTKEQVKLLARAARKIVLCLDADAAGAEATRKAIEVVGDTDVELRVIDMSEAEGDKKDVDDLARADSARWRELSERTIAVYEFLLRLSLRRHDATTPEGKREIIKEVGPVFAKIPHAVERDFYVKKLAEKLKVQTEVVEQDLRRLAGGAKLSRASAKPTSSPAPTAVPSRRTKLEQYAFFLLLEGKDFAGKLVELSSLQFFNPSLARISEHFAKKKTAGTPDIKQLSDGLGEDLKQTLFDVMYAPEFLKLKNTIVPEKEWTQTIKALQKELAREEIALLQDRITVLDEKTNRTSEEETEHAQLLRQVDDFKRRLR
jgi:DNA primase